MRDMLRGYQVDGGTGLEEYQVDWLELINKLIEMRMQ
jgi:hypothetical protein